jgi:hypothetical protein
VRLLEHERHEDADEHDADDRLREWPARAGARCATMCALKSEKKSSEVSLKHSGRSYVILSEGA